MFNENDGNVERTIIFFMIYYCIKKKLLHCILLNLFNGISANVLQESKNQTAMFSTKCYYCPTKVFIYYKLLRIKINCKETVQWGKKVKYSFFNAFYITLYTLYISILRKCFKKLFLINLFIIRDQCKFCWKVKIK